MIPLRVAIIGCGKVAAKHLKAIRDNHREAVLCALADTRPEAAADLLTASGYPVKLNERPQIFSDVNSMLAAVKPDLAAITTPSGYHFEQAMAAIQSGANVLVEKPLTLSLPEAHAMVGAAKTAGVRIAVGHIYRFFPMVQTLAADLHSGRFGRILSGDVKVRWGHDQAYYDQAAWRGTWELDGGALMNQSIHALDLITWLLGSPVREVTGWIGRQVHKIEAEDTGYAILRLENGSYCQVEGTTATDPDRQEASFTILCTGGEIRAGILAGKPALQVRDRKGHDLTGRYLRRFIAETVRNQGLSGFLQLKNPHSALYRDLIRAIREQRPPLADGLSGAAAVELVLAIYRSARENRPVQLPAGEFNLGAMKGFLRP